MRIVTLLNPSLLLMLGLSLYAPNISAQTSTGSAEMANRCCDSLPGAADLGVGAARPDKVHSHIDELLSWLQSKGYTFTRLDALLAPVFPNLPAGNTAINAEQCAQKLAAGAEKAEDDAETSDGEEDIPADKLFTSYNSADAADSRANGCSLGDQTASASATAFLLISLCALLLPLRKDRD